MRHAARRGARKVPAQFGGTRSKPVGHGNVSGFAAQRLTNRHRRAYHLGREFLAETAELAHFESTLL